MENLDQITSVISLVSDGGLIVFLVLSVAAFIKGWVIPKTTHTEQLETQEKLVTHLVDKVDARFDKHDKDFANFAEGIGKLSENYLGFQAEWRNALAKQNGGQEKMILILDQIKSELEKQNGK